MVFINRIGNWYDKIAWRFMNNESRIEFIRRKGTTIGENCNISGNVRFGTEPYLIKIGNHVRLTSNVKFITHDGSIWVLRGLKKVNKNMDKFDRIEIGNNVNVGWDVTIMPGVTIGDNCIVGAGSIITKSIPSNSVAAGVPAKIIGTIEEYYEKNKDTFVCTKHMDYEEKKKFLLERMSEIQ